VGPVANPAFAVSVAELRRGPIHASWSVPLAWLRTALEHTEATPTGDGTLVVELTASGTEVMVRGRATVTVTMPCARTLEPVTVPLSPEIFLLLSPAAPPAAPLHSARGSARSRIRQRHRSADRPSANSYPRMRGRGGWANDPLLPDELAAQDTYEGEQVVLDGFLREFILLELPMMVRRSDLPLAEDAAIGAPSGCAGSVLGAQRSLDPRLAPLAAIASRLRRDKE
jgi:uncharacterized protein